MPAAARWLEPLESWGERAGERAAGTIGVRTIREAVHLYIRLYLGYKILHGLGRRLAGFASPSSIRRCSPRAARCSRWSGRPAGRVLLGYEQLGYLSICTFASISALDARPALRGGSPDSTRRALSAGVPRAPLGLAVGAQGRREQFYWGTNN